jgi:alanyl-tRNA synthetase
LILDGVTPSNEGRGYVLRRIIRRAIRHGYQLGQTGPFFHRLVDALVIQMGEAYPELARDAARVRQVLSQEESRFAETLTSGMAILDQTIAAQAAAGASRVIPGETVFKLYDTFGFPVDLTADVARERGFTIDESGFETAMNRQRDRARAASRFAVDLRTPSDIAHRTEFHGYEQLSADGTVLALLDVDGQSVKTLAVGAIGQVVLDRTSFYAESGGQIGDVGVLSGSSSRFDVEDTQKIRDAFAHRGRVAIGALTVGDRLSAHVTKDTRIATARNHSATHLLHEALRRVLGLHVQQKGSLVQADRLRFDFAHGAPLTADELSAVEKMVNAEILHNLPTSTQLMSYDAAVAAGAMALFGEKYGDTVRVLSFGDYSTELCGGTHVTRTGDIGLFKILAETGVAAGVRRIEAVTGTTAFDYLLQSDQWLRQVGQAVRAGRTEVLDKVEGLLDRTKRLERELDQLKVRLASGQGTDLASTAVDVRGIKVIAARLDGLDAKALRTTVDQLKEKLGSAVIVLGSADADLKVIIVAGVTADLVTRIKAGDIASRVAAQVGGKGGGRADFAQAGGSDATKLDGALGLVLPMIEGIG